VLGAGVGFYPYFDTTSANEGADYQNSHGLALIESLGATWYFEDRWLAQLRLNWTQTDTSLETWSVVVGVGFQLVPAGTEPPKPSPDGPRNEITLFAGRTIVNSFRSEFSFAQALEYRRVLGSYGALSLAWLGEGGNELVRRNGLVLELWGRRTFFDDRLELGAGAGPYLALDDERSDDGSSLEDDEIVALMISMRASWSLSEHWGVPATWNRVLTGYERDTDVLLVGLSYRF
jgi:hypothetical protein